MATSVVDVGSDVSVCSSEPNSSWSISALGDLLSDASAPLAHRFRCLYELKARGGPEAVTQLDRAFGDRSALLKHELAYNMGQIGDISAIPILLRVLRDLDEDTMVRHEAAEALGAIGEESILEELERFRDGDVSIEVRQTCELAVDRIHWIRRQKEARERDDGSQEHSYFCSVDPAPSVDADKERSIEELRKCLLDNNVSLFDRYRAMFSLRNKGTEDAVKALCDGLHDESALFRHEIAFVLGQLEHPASIQPLCEVLRREDEHYMVRHEAAEALGAIAEHDVLESLKMFQQDSQPAVRESCEVALDMYEYWSQFKV